MKQYRIRVSETQVREYRANGETAEQADDKVMAGDCGEGRLIDSTINDVEIEEVKEKQNDDYTRYSGIKE